MNHTGAQELKDLSSELLNNEEIESAIKANSIDEINLEVRIEAGVYGYRLEINNSHIKTKLTDLMTHSINLDKKNIIDRIKELTGQV